MLLHNFGLMVVVMFGNFAKLGEPNNICTVNQIYSTSHHSHDYLYINLRKLMDFTFLSKNGVNDFQHIYISY